MSEKHTISPESAAGNIMHNLDYLTPDMIVEAAPDGREEEAREASRAVEDLYLAIDNAMDEVQRVIEE